MGFSRFDKITRGQILAVNPLSNKCLLRLSEIVDEVEAELTYPFISSLSGIRFMPRVGDTVLVGYTSGLVPKIIGFELMPNQNETSIELSNTGQQWYRKLNPGDLVIYGGRGDSELFISSNGEVSLGSGVNVLSLDAIRRSIDGLCGSFRLESLNGVTIKGGNVYRTIPPQPIEQVVPNTVEFAFDINSLTGKIVEMKAGNVLDDLGVPEVGVGGPKLFSLKTYAGVIPVGEIYMDSLTTVIKNEAVVNLDAPIIRLGGVVAIQPAVLGTNLTTLLTTLVNQVIILAGSVEPRSGQEAAVAGVITQLQALVPTINSILSTKVVLE